MGDDQQRGCPARGAELLDALGLGADARRKRGVPALLGRPGDEPARGVVEANRAHPGGAELRGEERLQIDGRARLRGDRDVTRDGAAERHRGVGADVAQRGAREARDREEERHEREHQQHAQREQHLQSDAQPHGCRNEYHPFSRGPRREVGPPRPGLIRRAAANAVLALARRVGPSRCAGDVSGRARALAGSGRRARRLGAPPGGVGVRRARRDRGAVRAPLRSKAPRDRHDRADRHRARRAARDPRVRDDRPVRSIARRPALSDRALVRGRGERVREARRLRGDRDPRRGDGDRGPVLALGGRVAEGFDPAPRVPRGVRGAERDRAARRDRPCPQGLARAPGDRDQPHARRRAELPTARRGADRGAQERRGAPRPIGRRGDPPGGALRAQAAARVARSLHGDAALAERRGDAPADQRAVDGRAERVGRAVPRGRRDLRGRDLAGRAGAALAPQAELQAAALRGALSGARGVRVAAVRARAAPRAARGRSRAGSSLHAARDRSHGRGRALRGPRDPERARVRAARAREGRAGQALPRGRGARRGDHRGRRDRRRREELARDHQRRLRGRHALRREAKTPTRSGR